MCYSFLDQSYTWSRLEICEEHFRKLFTCLKVHPNFLDIVQLFSEKVRPVEEGFSGFFINHSDHSVRDDPMMNNKDSSYSTRLFSLLIYADMTPKALGIMLNTLPATVEQIPKILSLSEKSASINTIPHIPRSAVGFSCKHPSNFKTG
jgi:hypothetical protein